MVAATAFAPAVWGTTYLVTTLALPAGYPLWSGALRALPAGLLVLAIGGALPRGAWWWKALVLGTVSIGAFFHLLFLAASLLPGGVAAIFGATGPLIIAALAVPLLGERPTAWRPTCGGLAVVGIAVMVTAPGAGLSITGVPAGLAATASMALGTVLSKRWGRPTGPAAHAGWQLTAGVLVIVPLALRDRRRAGVHAVVSRRRAHAARRGGLPAAGLPAGRRRLGWAVLGQGLTALQGAGFALALLAVASAQHTPTRVTRIDPATQRDTPGADPALRGASVVP